MRRFLLALTVVAALTGGAVAFQPTDCPPGSVCLGSGDSKPVYFIQDGARRAEVSSAGLLVVPGALSGARGTVCGTLDSNTTEVQTAADTNPTDFYTFTIKPGTIAANGRGVEIIASGKFGATGNTKNLFIVFAGNAIVSRASTSSAGGWTLAGQVTRTSATAGLGRGTAWTDTTSFASVPASQAGTWAGNIDLVVRGANGTAAAGDIVYQSAIVRCF